MCRWANETQRNSVSLRSGPPGLGEDKFRLAASELEFFHSGMELGHLDMVKTRGTWRQSLILAPINLITVTHPPMHGSPK